MTDVIIAGIGQTTVEEHWELSLRELGLRAIEAAIQDSGGLSPQALFVGNMLAPQLSRQAHVATLLTDFSGLTGIEAVSVEAAGASGGAALRAGYLAIASGQAGAALVVGVEKFTDVIGAGVETALSSAADSDYENIQGLTMVGQAAMLMRRYQHEFDVPNQGFAGFAINAHANGAGNPNAMFQKAITAETYSKASLVSDPLNLFDVAPTGDGAAAILLASSDLLPGAFHNPLVRITGSSMVSDTLALHDREDPLYFKAVQLSVQRACQKARLSPLQVDLFELHDSFSIYAALTLEAAGFALRGEGWKLAQDGCINLHGSLPINTMGGLKARGNPGGASGVYQAVEATLQLRGTAGRNQIPGARRAMIQALGGPASNVATHILELVN